MATPSLGRGHVVRVSVLPVGVTAAPATQTITLTAAATKDTVAPASIAVPSLTGAIPANNYLTFLTPTGAEIIVFVTTAAAASDTSLVVSTIDQAIPIGSVAVFPPILDLRESVDLNFSGSSEDYSTFESGIFQLSFLTSIAASATAPGFYNFFGAGYRNAEYAALNGLSVWFSVTAPPPSAAYSSGRIVAGPAFVLGVPLAIPATGALRSDIEITFSAAPTIIEPVATA